MFRWWKYLFLRTIYFFKRIGRLDDLKTFKTQCAAFPAQVCKLVHEHNGEYRLKQNGTHSSFFVIQLINVKTISPICILVFCSLWDHPTGLKAKYFLSQNSSKQIPHSPFCRYCHFIFIPTFIKDIWGWIFYIRGVFS